MNERNLGNVEHFINHDNRIMYIKRHDNLTKDGIYAEWEAMQQFEGFDPSYETIHDYSSVPRIDLTASDIIEINKQLPNYDVRTNNAAIVAGLLKGRHMLGNFFCTIANVIGHRKFQMFSNQAEAELWLFSQRKHE